jgi:hypothetical protein
MDEWTSTSLFGSVGSGTRAFSVGDDVPARSSMAFSAALPMLSPMPM